MRKAIIILAAIAAAIIAFLAFLGLKAHDDLVAERNAQKTLPARTARLEKLKQQQAAEEAPQTEANEEVV